MKAPLLQVLFRSASRGTWTVDRRCATTSTVRPDTSRSTADCTSRSLIASSAAVAALEVTKCLTVFLLSECCVSHRLLHFFNSHSGATAHSTGSEACCESSALRHSITQRETHRWWPRQGSVWANPAGQTALSGPQVSCHDTVRPNCILVDIRARALQNRWCRGGCLDSPYA